MSRAERRRQQEADAADDLHAMNARPNEPPAASPDLCKWSRYGAHRYRLLPGAPVARCEFCQQPQPRKGTR